MKHNAVVDAADEIGLSHAHEQIPGTVNLRAIEGDDTAYGQAYYPVPSTDPNDPLQVRTFHARRLGKAFN